MRTMVVYKHINNREDVLNMVGDNGDGTYKMINSNGDTVNVRDIVLRRWYRKSVVEVIVPAAVDTQNTDNQVPDELPMNIKVLVKHFLYEGFTAEYKKNYVRIKPADSKKTVVEIYFTKKGGITLATKEDRAQRLSTVFNDVTDTNKVPDSYGWSLNYKVKFHADVINNWCGLTARYVVNCFM